MRSVNMRNVTMSNSATIVYVGDGDPDEIGRIVEIRIIQGNQTLVAEVEFELLIEEAIKASLSMKPIDTGQCEIRETMISLLNEMGK